MRRISYTIVLAVCSVLAIWHFWSVLSCNKSDASTPVEEDANLAPESWDASQVPHKMIVMGKLGIENTSWVQQSLPDWNHSIYIVDDTSAPLHTMRNKGREANAYLTFIIEHYHHLPDISVFIHSHRAGFPEAWHTDAIGHDIVNALNALNLTYVEQQGYINLRCNPDPGCYGLIIEPLRHVNDVTPLNRDAASEIAWLDAWPHLKFNGEDEVPREIGTACCAQFAVSRKQILHRPLEDYVRYHQWLMSTRMSDEISGRILEYSWHMIFGKQPMYCPAMRECYNNQYPGIFI